jgi:hypothetical protein
MHRLEVSGTVQHICMLLGGKGLNANVTCALPVPMKMEQAECSETLAFKLQMLVNPPEENLQHI